MARQQSKEATKSKHFFESLNARPVTREDKWCDRPTQICGRPALEGEWGYIITLPYLPSRNILLDGIQGYAIVRCKKYKKQFLLQIVRRKFSENYLFYYGGYGMSSHAILPSRDGKKKKNKKKIARIWNIRNLNKRLISDVSEWLNQKWWTRSWFMCTWIKTWYFYIFIIFSHGKSSLPKCP